MGVGSAAVLVSFLMRFMIALLLIDVT